MYYLNISTKEQSYELTKNYPNQVKEIHIYVISAKSKNPNQVKKSNI